MNQKLNCILLIDDDKATNFLNKRLLSKMHVATDIHVARNGVEALEYLQKSSAGADNFPWPELILLDINMPLVNGWEFLEKYDQLPEEARKSTIILMLTTSLRKEDEQRAGYATSIKGYIKKPLTQIELEKIIEKHFASLKAGNS